MVKEVLLFQFAIASLTFPVTVINEIKKWPHDPLVSRVLMPEDEENILKTRPIVISLGDSCQPALNLMYAKLRFMAYPFDWAVASFDDVYDMIRTDFVHCSKPEHFANAWDPKLGHPRLTNVRYPNLLFPHAHQETLFEDFDRRVKRFYKAISYCASTQKKIYFIIHSSTFQDSTIQNKACKLRDLLKEKFPGLDFTLIVMHHVHTSFNSNDDRCLYCYLHHAGWTQESYNEWGQKFIEMGLINPHAAGDSFSEHPFKSMYEW